MQLNFMYIYQMFRRMARIWPTSLGNQYFGKADGLPGAGHFKSLLLRN
jgi:hypothetical protein